MEASRNNATMAIAILALVAAAPWYGASPAGAGETATGARPAVQQEPAAGAVAPQPQGDEPLSRVAIVASASADVHDALFTDPRDKLLGTGQFSDVAVINAGQTTPALADLLAFDALLVWSNFEFADPVLLGDRLADYVDQGHGVVLAVFANTSNGIERFLGGRWETDGYDVIVAQQGTTSGPASLGTIYEPAHELMQEVTTFSGGMLSSRPTTTMLDPNGSLIAEWSDGKPLITVRNDLAGRRVDLGFYPPSSDAVFFLWDAATDGDVLLANALKYAAGGPPADVEVRLVPRLTPSAVDVTTDGLALNNVLFATECGDLTSFVLEVWASDVGETNTGILGLYLDLAFDQQVLQASGVVHSAAMPTLAEGTINNPAGAVSNFGGFRAAPFTPLGIEPAWVRIGYVQMSVIAESQTMVTTTLGIGNVAVSGRTAPSPSEIEFGIAHLFPSPHGDADSDCDIDLIDFAQFQRCFGESGLGVDCAFGDFDSNNAIDATDYAGFGVVLSGPGAVP